MTDIFNCIYAYSKYENDINNGYLIPDEDTIIGLHTLRYVLAISPSLSLSKQGDAIIKNNLIYSPNLFVLTKLLILLTQFRCIASLCNSPAISIDLSKSWVDIRYLDCSLEKKIHLSKTKGIQLLCPKLIDYSIPRHFSKLLLKVFGEPASLFNDFISEPQGHLSYNNQVRPINLTKFINRNIKSVFIKELILTSESVNLLNVISKPHIIDHRTRFKPILKLNVDQEFLYVTSQWLVFETFSELSLNRLPFQGLPESWRKYSEIKDYANKIHLEVGQKFEQFIANQIDPSFEFYSNIKQVNNTSVETAPVIIDSKDTGRTVGEIDFLIINPNKHILYVADAKHLKSKYLISSFYGDKSKFDNYVIKLLDKYNWVKGNIHLVNELFTEDITTYSVQMCFITQAYVFYALFVEYPIIPASCINQYISTNNKFCYLHNEAN